MTLDTNGCSIAIVFAPPSDWLGTRREDYELVHRLLAEAGEALLGWAKGRGADVGARPDR